MTQESEDELQRLFDKAAESQRAAMRAVWYAGVAHGVQHERARITGIINTQTASLKTAPSTSPSAPPPGSNGSAPPATKAGESATPTALASSAPEYGAISRPVREALQKLPYGPSGASIFDIAAFINNSAPGLLLSMGQVRTALKVLAKRKEAVRVSRGRYALPKKEAPPTEAGGASKENAGGGIPTKEASGDLQPQTPASKPG